MIKQSMNHRLFYFNKSTPPFEKGLHFNNLLNPKNNPFNVPYFSKASIVYSEQVG